MIYSISSFFSFLCFISERNIERLISPSMSRLFICNVLFHKKFLLAINNVLQRRIKNVRSDKNAAVGNPTAAFCVCIGFQPLLQNSLWKTRCSSNTRLVEAMGVEPMSKNQSVSASPSADISLNSLTQALNVKLMCSVAPNPWQGQEHFPVHFHRWNDTLAEPRYSRVGWAA